MAEKKIRTSAIRCSRCSRLLVEGDEFVQHDDGYFSGVFDPECAQIEKEKSRALLQRLEKSGG